MVGRNQQIEVELSRFLGEVGRVPPSLSLHIAQVLLYVHQHLFDFDLSVKVIKAKCSLRDNNISMRFRNAMGVGLREYIETLRLEAADRLLSTGRYPIYLVAMSVGYSHQETFCRAFLRRFGCNPSDRFKSRRGGPIQTKDQEETSEFSKVPGASF